MKALVSHGHGPLRALEIVDLPVPRPRAGELLLRTEAVSLNGVDPKLITGEIPVRLNDPFVPGVDIAAVVESTGSDVSRFRPGDKVIASLGAPSGALAEYVVAGDDSRIALRPEGLSAASGAALVTAAMTAATVLDAANVHAGETVLVVGATGGVGTFTVQAARRHTPSVYATGRPDDRRLLVSLGAEDIVERDGDLAESVRRVVPGGADVVLDVVRAGPALALSAAAARKGGRVVSVLGGPPAFDRGVTVAYIVTQFPPGRLAEVAAAAAKGDLIVPIAARYPFRDAVQAYVDFAGGHVLGKFVVEL
jgi:NADPH:quinone reductase-like Zn-dependent oxidoreductase